MAEDDDFRKRPYIPIGVVNPVYEDQLQGRMNLDDQRPLGDAVEAARKEFYTRNTTKGRNNFASLILEVIDLRGKGAKEKNAGLITKFLTAERGGDLVAICRIFTPELHLFGEIPQFNLVDGKFDPIIGNKIKMYPLAAVYKLGEGEGRNLKKGKWVSVNFLDPVNYEFGVIVDVLGIPEYTGQQIQQVKNSFDVCRGDCSGISFMPQNNIQFNGRDRRSLSESVLPPDQLDLLVSAIAKSKLAGDIQFFIARSIIAAESANNPLALSQTGCAGYGQFCFGTAQTYYKDFVGGSSSNKEPKRYPNPRDGRVKVIEGPSGKVYEAIYSRTDQQEDIIKSLSVNFFGGSTKSFVEGRVDSNNERAANDYINFLRGFGTVTDNMKGVMKLYEIEVEDNQTDEQVINSLYSFLRENEPYNQFLNSISKSTAGVFILVPRNDARFDGEKNISATVSFVKAVSRDPRVRSNPYAFYMWFNEGRGNQNPVMDEVLKKNNNQLNFKEPKLEYWNNELFQSIATQVRGKNPILRNKSGPGKYVKYVKNIFPKISEELKRHDAAFRKKVNIDGDFS